MNKRLNWILLFSLLAFLMPHNIFAKEDIRLLVVPFRMNSEKDVSDLQPKIIKLMEDHFEESGAIIIKPEEILKSIKTTDVINAPLAKSIGKKAMADYVVWGSIILVGDKFSIDAKMIEPLSDKDSESFFADGQSAANLFAKIKDIAESMSVKLFKQIKVSEIVVAGNKRIESEAVLNKISTKKGDAFSVKRLSSDLELIYKMGFFEDIKIAAEDTKEGKKVIFNIVEKPTVRAIKIEGNDVYSKDEIKENLTIKIGSILNVMDIQTSVSRIEELYKSKNYQNVKVKYKVGDTEKDQADINFIIEEGKKIRIKQIKFNGNNVYSEKRLKKLMKTDEQGFLSWLTSSGELKTQDVEQDAAQIAAFYQNSGYVFAKVSDPIIEYKEDGIYITIEINEGDRFKVGKVKFEGDIIKESELQKNIKIKEEKFFNKEVLRNDVLLLTDIYSDEGYAYAKVVPLTNNDLQNKVIDVTYDIKKGNQVYFEKILIQGNTKTRDKVIRRELKVYENELYSGKNIKRGVQNLNRLDFFENVQVDTVEGESNNTMLMKINVTEKSTGVFSFGGGYSSLDKLYGTASITQRNFLGKGENVSLKVNAGSVTTRYDLSFTEPWLFDIPLSAQFNVFNWETDYDSYNKRDRGVGFEFGYPVFDFTRAYIAYMFEDIRLTDVNQSDTPDSIQEMEGTNIESSITTTLRYDSRNRWFNATEGSMHSISLQYAGVANNDISFTKVRMETGWYIPLFKKLTGIVHAKGGYVTENSGGMLPTYERFNLGGINSLRGFDWQDLSPKKLNSNGVESSIGGNKFVQFNVETVFPLFEKAGMAGVVFFDTGDVYDNDESINLGRLRESVGGGIRWLSPLGPIRIEYGHILDRKQGESSGKFEFTMGSSF